MVNLASQTPPTVANVEASDNLFWINIDCNVFHLKLVRIRWCRDGNQKLDLVRYYIVTWHEKRSWVQGKWKCESETWQLKAWSGDLAPEEAKLGAVNRIGSSPTIPPFGVQPFFNSSIFLRGFVFVFGIVFWLSAVCLRGKLGQQGLRHVGPQFVIDLFSIFVDVNLLQLFEKSWTEAKQSCLLVLYVRAQFRVGKHVS